MKETTITKATKEAIRITMQALDEVIKEDIEALADIGNPEKLIGKKYEEWTPQDLQMLANVYGQQEPNPLSNFIFKREYEKVKRLEEEVE